MKTLHKHICNVAEPAINTHIFKVLAHKGLHSTLLSYFHVRVTLHYPTAPSLLRMFV